ncbi:hypothetical protein B0H17DRAFT_1197960 [Mycena rosella]|uniref:Uncharacterized protein n=1 Tax=Mycena rosella TaxID=1033263 RepID=A0AAD7DRF5_MYCRO|nr:hypothetical protein B0H17DRAFT_1197960 [Mycena rosella]
MVPSHVLLEPPLLAIQPGSLRHLPSGPKSLGSDYYIETFVLALHRAPKITQTDVFSVAYCHTRGTNDYPFLLVHLRHETLRARPVLMRLRGFDGPPAVKQTWDWMYDTNEEPSTCVIEGNCVSEVVDAKRYDVSHTIVFPKETTPSIVDWRRWQSRGIRSVQSPRDRVLDERIALLLHTIPLADDVRNLAATDATTSYLTEGGFTVGPTLVL